MSVMLSLSLLPRRVKQFGLGMLDTLAMPVVLHLSYMLRLGDWPTPGLIPPSIYAILSGATVGMLAMVGVYRIVVRAFDETLLRDIVLGLVLVSALLQLWGALIPDLVLPRTVPFIFVGLAFFWLWGSRTLIRALVVLETRSDGEPVVIYGAGRRGRQVISALKNTPLHAIALLDDDPELIGTSVAGLNVHSGARLEKLLDRLPVSKLLLAMPSLPQERLKAILAIAEPLQVKVCALPAMDHLVNGELQVSDLREVDIVDLLGREPVEPDPALLQANIQSQIVLVTGAGGSIGSELCRQIARCFPRKLLLWDVAEYNLYAIEHELRRQYPSIEIVAVLGSILEQDRLERLMRLHAVQTVYHAAAYKHVPLVETNPFSGLWNNVQGTWSASVAARNAGVNTFVLISTDKAVRPTNVMGASKRLAEMVLQALAAEQSGQTRYVMVRFGNVLGSSGSVVPLFRSQIASGGPVTITHPNITRYFMTIPEASQLVIQAGALGKGGDVFVLDMGEPVLILDLAKQMIQLSGRTLRSAENPAGQIELVFTGLRPGEKLYEELLIGDDVAPTTHPRIMSAYEKHIELVLLKQVLARIQDLADRQDVAGLKALLATVIQGYVPDMISVGAAVDGPASAIGKQSELAQ